MDNAEQPNQLARSFAFFFYAFCVFVGIRVWIEVVASGDKSAIIAASVITFLVVCCIYSRYRRHRRLMEMRNRRRVAGGLDMFELFARHRGLLEAEGINVQGGLTQAAIDRLPNVVFKNGRLQMLPSAEDRDELVNKLEEGTLVTGSSSSSAPEGNQYKSVSTTIIGDDAIEKEIARAIITNHNDINSCPICLNDFVLDEVLLFLPKCGHAYHRACISEWLVNHNSCPLCKHEVVAMPVLPENDPLIVNAEANNNHMVNFGNRPIVVVDDGGIAILRFPNQQGVGIYFMDPDVNNGRSLRANNNAAVTSAPNSDSPLVDVNNIVSTSSSG